MNKQVLFFLLFTAYCGAQELGEVIARQGEMSFISYTSVERIEAENDQVLSLLDLNSGEIAMSVLMRAFKFEKSLMEEHFNESYVESDLFPNATFKGVIKDFDAKATGAQTRLVNGFFTLRGIQKPLEFKVIITKIGDKISVNGEVEITVKDYNIKIPSLLSPNIAKNIQVTFNFDYVPFKN